jgi:hypothetical protein
MAIVQALIAAVLRSSGRLLNTAFGWATVMVFGKVPQDRQIYLSVLAFGSVLWILVVLGIAFPAVGTFLLAFVPLPKWVSKGLVRLVMLALAIVLPAVVGWMSLLLKAPEERPKEWGSRLRTIGRGYPFTLGLAATLILMTVFAPIMKLRALVKRWSSAHVPLLIEAEDYDAVVGELRDQLREAGWETERVPATWMLRLPTRVLTALAGGAADDLVAKELATLRSPQLEVTLHPADLVIEGRPADVVDARSALAERLAFSRGHLTWTKEGQQLEDRIRAAWREVAERHGDPQLALGRLASVTEDLRAVEVPYEEWEVLFREKCLAELSIYRRRAVTQPAAWTQRTLVPLALAAARTTLESRRVRARLERVVLHILGELDPRRARRQEPPQPGRRETRRAA